MSGDEFHEWDEEGETLRLVSLIREFREIDRPLYAAIYTPPAVAPHMRLAYLDGRVQNVTEIFAFDGWFACSLGLFPATDTNRAARALAKALSTPQPR
ncbi:hypothetical protein GCM10009678_42830 [Actinomadura kijaniata]|uniref:Uncharacterized protein n=1 Tax=Actinomadura namibiensis TaxID=182080 RepID=A0A7W3QP82_ACTNM|nr:hypothetical protein [Actinomadura namibiensis]MBA8954326.1 hypothetical protein [Actinomadura namibiensis]